MAQVKLTAPHGSGVVSVESDRVEKYEAVGWTRVSVPRKKQSDSSDSSK